MASPVLPSGALEVGWILRSNDRNHMPFDPGPDVVGMFLARRALCSALLGAEPESVLGVVDMRHLFELPSLVVV
jgi:hypothetical protein